MDEPKPLRRHPRPVIKPAEQSHNFLAVGLVLLTAAGGGFFVLASAGMRSTAGARVSTRLKWERRAVEIDQALAEVDRKPDAER